MQMGRYGLWRTLLCFCLCLGLYSTPATAQPCAPDGDVNLDNRLTMEDAALAFQHALGRASPVLTACQQMQANVRDSETSGVTFADVLCLFQDFFGLPSCLNPPVANAGGTQFLTPSPQTAVFPAVTVDGSASTDPQGTGLSYHWTFHVPSGVPSDSSITDEMLTDSGAAQSMFTPDSAGLYILDLTVTDSRGLVARDFVRINVQDLDDGGSPGCNCADSPGETVGLSVPVTDDDGTPLPGQPVTFTVTQGDGLFVDRTACIDTNGTSSLNQCTVLTNANGIAVAPLVLGAAPEHLVTAEPPNAPPVIFRILTADSTAEVLLIWAEATGQDSFQKIYDRLPLNAPDASTLDPLIPQSRQSETAARGIAGDRQIDVITGDFNSDGTTDVIAAWEGPERAVQLFIPLIVPETLAWTQAHRLTLQEAGGLLIDSAETPRQLRLVAGNFDTDPAPEFVLAYWAADETIRLRLYDTHGTLMPEELATIADESLPALAPRTVALSARFDIASGDVDGDGSDEIILTAAEPTFPCEASFGCWSLWVKVYDVVVTEGGSASLVPAARMSGLFTVSDNSDRWVDRLAVAAGDMDGDTVDDVVVGYEVAHNGATHFFYLQPLRVSEALSRITLGERITLDQTLGNRGWPLSLVMGDVNGDGRDDLLAAAREQLRIFAADAALRLTSFAGTGLSVEPGDDTHRSIALATVSGASVRREVAVGESIAFSLDGGISLDRKFRLRVFEPVTDVDTGRVSLQLKAEVEDEITDSSALRPYVIALGNFDGE